MDFHRGKRAEGCGKIFIGHRERFGRRFSFDQFRGHTGDGNGGLASEGLERGLVDHAASIFVAELNPHPQHVSAVATASGSDGIRFRHFPEIFGIPNGLVDFFFCIHSVV